MKKKFNIAINISPLSNGNSVRGVGYYTKNIVDSIQKEIQTNSDYSDFNVQLITDNSPLTTNFDLVHYPYFDPFNLTLPLTSTPFIVSLHDLIPIEFKQHFPVGIKGNLKWQIQKILLQRAKYIITISHYSKYSIHQLTHYPLDKIFTTYLAADPSFKPIQDQSLLKKIKEKYNLPDKFVFYLGDINWNKNIPRLVNACLELKYPLVIAGSSATKKTPDHPWTKDILWLQSKALKYQKSNKLILTGFVPDEDLPIIFNLATLYCQPSYAEGFGLPPLQAMQSGCPVVYSQDTSIPEVVDYCGLPFDPHNTHQLKENIKKLWTDSSLREQLSQKGLNRAATFSWRQTALSTLSVYRLALLDEKK